MEFFAITSTRMVRVMTTNNGRVVPEAIAPLQVIEDLGNDASQAMPPDGNVRRAESNAYQAQSCIASA